MHIDSSYRNLLVDVMNKGVWYDDPNRKNVRRLEIPSATFRHEFKDGFPAISTKKLFFKSVTTELIWFLNGDTNIKYLVDNGCNIWNKDAYNYYLRTSDNPVYDIDEFIEYIKNNTEEHLKKIKFGDLGPVYGHQWVKTGGNQIQQLVKNMIEKPMSSELVVNAWNQDDLKKMALQPCHYGFQIIMIPGSLHDLSREDYKLFRQHYVESVDPTKDGVISMREFYKTSKFYKVKGFELHWNQRSCDLFLGIPFNIASYAELALILQKVTGCKALAIQGDLKKVHLYDNSIESVKEQISRKSNLEKVELLMKDEFHYITDKSISGDVSLDTIFNEMKPDWFKLENYNPQPAIKVEMLERR